MNLSTDIVREEVLCGYYFYKENLIMSTFLSVCMIVRDEEKVIERCLESIHGIADEIIVVDTGSVDRTKEITKHFTNKIYDFEWVNDFAKARNYAASKAEGEWIFVIDADEYVERENFQQFKENLKVEYQDYEILAPQIISFIGKNASQTVLNYHERIYKNNGFVEYDRPVHEVLVHKNGQSKICKSDFSIYHSGYMAETINEKNKRERNLTILLNNKNKNAIDYFYLGNEYAALGQRKKAIDYYKKAFQKQTNHQVEWDKKLLVNLISCLYQEKRNQEALLVAQASGEKYPTHADYMYYQGLIYLNIKEFEKARIIFEQILQNKDQLEADSSLDILELLPMLHLAKIYEDKNVQKSVEYYSKVVSLTENNLSQWIRLLYLIGKNSTLEQLTDFINRNVVSTAGMTEHKLLKILLEVPILNVQKLSRSLLNSMNLTESQNAALLVKNHLLDYHFEEVYAILDEWSDEKIAEVLHTKFFAMRDFIIFTMLVEYERGIKIMSRLNTSAPIKNFLLLIFENGRRNLNDSEEDLFLQVYKQASVLGIENVTELLNDKVFALGEEKRKELKDIQEKKY